MIIKLEERVNDCNEKETESERKREKEKRYNWSSRFSSIPLYEIISMTPRDRTVLRFVKNDTKDSALF